MAKPIEVHVRLDAATFRHFCNFDALRRRRLWYWPALIGLVLMCVASFLLLRGQGSGAAAGVLMGIGIAVPAGAFALYAIQIEAQVASQGLKASPPVYSLRLAPEGLRIVNDRKDEPPIDVPWDRVHAAFRDKGAAYLYVTPQRAFILPDGQASASDAAVWQALREYLGDDRCADATAKKSGSSRVVI